MSHKDRMTRFFLPEHDFRGELVVLDQSMQEVLSRAAYPEPVAACLGDACVAALLLSATLKFEGATSIQARGKGALTLLMAEATHLHNLRGLAHWQEPLPAESEDLATLLGRDAALAVTLTPTRGQRYQGVVPLVQESLATCLEDYFRQSEQLSTRVWLRQEGQAWCGLLLQQLPGPRSDERDLAWEHVTTLAETITGQELATLSGVDVLYRLFHQEQCQVNAEQPIRFGCSCSRERTAEMLQSLGETEVREILSSHDPVEIRCQFCNQRYAFDTRAIDQLFGGRTLH